MSKVQLVEEFSLLFNQLIENIAIIRPKSMIGTNITMIRVLCRQTSIKQKLIHLFAIHFVQYRPYFDRNDDSFLAGVNFNQKVDGDTKAMRLINHLLGLWRELDTQNRRVFFQYLKLMATTCSDYLRLFT